MASAHYLRRINETRVLNLLFSEGPCSRADLARELGITRSTASSLVAGLAKQGLVIETQERIEADRTGRPGVFIKLNALSRAFIGIDIAVAELRFAALDMNADVFASCTVPYRQTPRPDYVAKLLKESLADFLSQNAIKPGRLEGIGIAIPGLVERSGFVSCAPILDWHNVDMNVLLDGVVGHEGIERDVLIHFENDANACAVSEHYRHDGQHLSEQASSLAFFLIDSGVGLGLLMDGVPLRGHGGIAGELGHARFAPSDADGTAADTGTFETQVARDAVLALCVEHHVPASTIRELTALAEQGHEGARHVFDLWVRRLAVGLCNVTMIVNPSEIVLGGRTSVLASVDPDHVRSVVGKQLHPMFKAPPIRTADLGVFAAAAGAASVMHNRSMTLEPAAQFATHASTQIAAAE
ncbi:MAG: ROK family transcriptional regulator [Pseudomonadota bacterium]